MKYSREEINKIINLKGANGEQIDIFDLHGLLFIGNSKDGQWDLTTDGRYTRFSEHSLFIDYNDFSWCLTEDEVRGQFNFTLKDAISERLF